jgi:hypothetical protein
MIKKFLFQMDDPTKINIKEDSTYMLIKSLFLGVFDVFIILQVGYMHL